MSKEKQIEEMASIAYPGLDHQTVFSSIVYAQPLVNLYNAGYRMQSKGEWVEKNIFFAIYKCSICGAENLYKYGHACLSKFCPNCGAKMKGSAE